MRCPEVRPTKSCRGRSTPLGFSVRLLWGKIIAPRGRGDFVVHDPRPFQFTVLQRLLQNRLHPNWGKVVLATLDKNAQRDRQQTSHQPCKTSHRTSIVMIEPFPGSLHFHTVGRKLATRDTVSVIYGAQIRQMNLRGEFLRQLARVRSGLLTYLLLSSAHVAFANSPTNIFAPAATPARSIFSLSMLVLSVTLAIFLIVGGLLLYALIRFRHRSSDSEHEPAQIYGSNQIELSWTVIPILIVVMLFLTTTRVIWQTEAAPKPSGAVDVVVIGHQFWWEYRYPKLGVVTANELHIPTSDPKDPTPTYLEMSSADVSHSFWIPRLAGKTDLIPNRINTMWFDPPEAGLYLGQCAQYCGTQHAKMLLRVYADSPANFAAWIRRQQQVSTKNLSDNSAAQEGRAIFLRTACMNCHTIAGTSANGRFGPDLTHVASRDTIASGPIENTPQNLRKWIADPNVMKPGSLMPSMHLNDHDLDAITAYLTTLH